MHRHGKPALGRVAKERPAEGFRDGHRSVGGDPGGTSEPIEVAGDGPGKNLSAERQAEGLAVDAHARPDRRVASPRHGGGDLTDRRHAKREALGEPCPEAAGEPGRFLSAGGTGPAEGDDAGDPSGEPSFGIEWPLEIGKLEMGMGVDEAGKNDRRAEVDRVAGR